MSFDAPGSSSDPLAWLMRILIFLPGVIGVVVLILALRAFQAGLFRRAMLIAAIFPVSGIGLLAYLSITTLQTMNAFESLRAHEAEEARLHPKQKFFRPVEGGADSIIVFPSRMVAYRIYQGDAKHRGDQLGDLNQSRDTLIYYDHLRNELRRKELDQFADVQGRKITDFYVVK
jgi:hypothetical protein